jgi:hypothetical protein
MTPPHLAENRVFLGLNVATLLIYAGLSIMFFLVPFDLVDRRGLPPIDAGNNAASRIAQLIGVAIAAGVGSFVSGYRLGLMTAAAVSVAGALIVRCYGTQRRDRWRRTPPRPTRTDPAALFRPAKQ